MRVAEHVRDAFRARMEIVHNGINYLREEKMLCRNALAAGEVERYIHGYAKCPYWRMRGPVHRKVGQSAYEREMELALKRRKK
jgi:hypothetical protein